MAANTASDLIAALRKIATPAQAKEVGRFYQGTTRGTRILGVSIGRIFPIAKAHAEMAPAEIERLLDDPHYEVRMAGAAVMDFQARGKRIGEDGRKALFDLYTRRHDRLDNWDLVDRAAPWVVGEYLVGRSRAPLTAFAKSADPWRRRTAIVATHAFIKRGDFDETFRIAGLLAADDHPYVQKALASWLAYAGKSEPERLKAFLARHAKKLPRPVLRDASKPLAKADRDALLGQRS